MKYLLYGGNENIYKIFQNKSSKNFTSSLEIAKQLTRKHKELKPAMIVLFNPDKYGAKYQKNLRQYRIRMDQYFKKEDIHFTTDFDDLELILSKHEKFVSDDEWHFLKGIPKTLS